MSFCLLRALSCLHLSRKMRLDERTACHCIDIESCGERAYNVKCVLFLISNDGYVLACPFFIFGNFFVDKYLQ